MNEWRHDSLTQYVVTIPSVIQKLHFSVHRREQAGAESEELSVQFFDFRSGAPPYGTFDVSDCYPERQKMDLVFRVQSKLVNFLGDHGNRSDVSNGGTLKWGGSLKSRAIKMVGNWNIRTNWNINHGKKGSFLYHVTQPLTLNPPITLTLNSTLSRLHWP